MNIKICHNCKTEFEITPDDQAFYEKIGVNQPTFCPACRRQRRHTWRNDLTFYNRECDLCHRKIISLYSPDKPLTVYCGKCWWSDKWDPKSYGRDFDFSRPFFEQYRELQDVVPLIAMVNDDGVGSINCEYTQNVTFAKNCYMGSMSWKNEDCMYYYHVAGPNTKEVVDSNEIFQNCEWIYDCIFLERCYQVRHCYYSAMLRDSVFCYDCRDSSNCFISAGLRHKQYYFKNKPYSKEEYEKILASYRLDTYSGMEKARAEFLEFIKTYPRKAAYITNCVNSIGDSLFNCKNMYYCFCARGSEDCKYFESGNVVKDSYDLTTSGENSQCYESLTPDHDYRALFTIFSLKSNDITYCENCHSSKNLFGCSSIKSGEYCILNKQYDPKTWKEMTTRIIEHMKTTGEWGEFFPMSISPFPYEDTVAQDYFPRQQERKKQIYAIGGDILKCENASCVGVGAFRLHPTEVEFYKKMKLPTPISCFPCRLKARLARRNPRKLWKRECMKCNKEIETSYAPDRPEIVYCESCYNQEIA